MKLLYYVFAIIFSGVIIFSCQKDVISNSTANANATGTMSKTISGDCSPISLGGVFITNTVLTSASYMDVQVYFAQIGAYKIKTDTVNGYSFIGVGQIGVVGTSLVRLQATGSPIIAGVNVFTFKFNNSSCQANVIVSTASAVYSLGGTPSTCTGAVLAGIYTNGIQLTSNNTVTIQVNVSSIGAYSIRTDTINGITFSKSGIFTSTGVQPILLVANGVPLLAGLYTLTIQGSSGCNFAVPVSNATGALATLTTTAVSGITCTSAITGGNVSNNGGTQITARGICVSTIPMPSLLQGTIISSGIGTGLFSSNITGLVNGTIFYVRAYATNSAGTAYGNEISFTTTAGTCPVTIYVAGYNDNPSGNRTATVWKNSTGSYFESFLPNYGVANSIFVSGTDQYVVGTEGSFAKYWKNGISNSLFTSPNSVSYGNSIYVVGNDVYVAGENASKATVWKNGIASALSNGFYTAGANSVFVVGTDVYVVGYESQQFGGSSNPVSVAMIWKNGIPTSLTNGTNNSVANSVFVTGNDVYVAGNDGDNAKIWKNGIATTLTTQYGSAGIVARSIFVTGSDVYVAGNAHSGTSPNDIAIVWKNGIPTFLTNAGYRNYGKSVFVVGNDVYVAGSRESNNANSVATVWRNGFATPLTNASGDAVANSIFIK